MDRLFARETAYITALVIGVLYFAAAHYSLLLVGTPNGIALFWPAAGISAGIVLAGGRQAAIPVAAAAIGATLFANQLAERPAILGLLFGTLNAAEALLTGYFFAKMDALPARLSTFRQIVVFFAAAAGATLITGFFAGLVSAAVNDKNFLPEFATWTRSDFIGLISIAPIFVAGRDLFSRPVNPRVVILAMSLVIVTGAIAIVIFSTRVSGAFVTMPSMILFVPLLALAFLAPPFYSALASAFVASIIVVITIDHLAGLAPLNGDMQPLIDFAQLAIASLVGCSLSLAALVNERKQMELDLADRARHSLLLVTEITHRSKNLLAVVLAMARLAPREKSIDAFVEDFSGRLHALAVSTDLFTELDWQAVDLEALIKSQLVSLHSAAGSRFQMTGEPIALKPKVAQSLGMAFYELFTNAAKYGALSDETGTVSLTWKILRDGSPPRVRLVWQETGGPRVDTPKRKGFGQSVLKNIVRSTLNHSQVELNFSPDGVRWCVEAPLSSFTKDAPEDQGQDLTGISEPEERATVAPTA